MKYLGMFLVGSMAAACASDPPPPASSATVEAATDTPSNSTTPVKTDVMRAAEADRRAEQAAAGPTLAPDAAEPDARGLVATPAPAAGAPPASAPSTIGKEPDNTGVNARDRSNQALTPLDQGGSESDRKLTQQVRQAVMSDGTLSFTAKNVKIITVNGKVTLRGPVNTAEERASIEAAARKIAGATQVDNQLEVKK